MEESKLEANAHDWTWYSILAVLLSFLVYVLYNFIVIRLSSISGKSYIISTILINICTIEKLLSSSVRWVDHYFNVACLFYSKATAVAYATFTQQFYSNSVVKMKRTGKLMNKRYDKVNNLRMAIQAVINVEFTSDLKLYKYGSGQKRDNRERKQISKPDLNSSSIVVLLMLESIS